jgi:hypothetical protein
MSVTRWVRIVGAHVAEQTAEGKYRAQHLSGLGAGGKRRAGDTPSAGYVGSRVYRVVPPCRSEARLMDGRTTDEGRKPITSCPHDPLEPITLSQKPIYCNKKENQDLAQLPYGYGLYSHAGQQPRSRIKAVKRQAARPSSQRWGSQQPRP